MSKEAPKGLPPADPILVYPRWGRVKIFGRKKTAEAEREAASRPQSSTNLPPADPSLIY